MTTIRRQRLPHRDAGTAADGDRGRPDLRVVPSDADDAPSERSSTLPDVPGPDPRDD